MSVYIVRVASVGETLAGTIERPGGEQRPFHDPDDLVLILSGWERDERGDGSDATPPQATPSRVDQSNARREG
jgi:hypothetical protein